MIERGPAPASCLLFLCLALGPQEDTAAVAVAEGRYGDAWALALADEDPASNARERAAVLGSAGDLGGALLAAEEGLLTAPDHLELLWRCASTALTLREAGRAEAYTTRLARAVETADLAAEHRAGWELAVADFRERSAALVEHADARSRALARARWLTACLVVLALGVLFLGGRARADSG